MKPHSIISGVRRRRGLRAIICLAFAYAIVMQALGWAQTSNYALVRSLSHGTPVIDPYRWETRDESYYRGHTYSVKAPLLAFLATPIYKLLDAVDTQGASRWAAENARKHGSKRWYHAGSSNGLYGNSKKRAVLVRGAIERETPLVWALNLLGAVVPAFFLLLLVRAIGERVEPGFGAIAAVTLGTGTLIMPFATLFFSHVLSATLGFGAFALLWREREGPPRLLLVALAGLIAGLAVVSEYPLAIAAAIIGVYASSRGNVARRALTYASGVAIGVAPLLLYNLWAFGSITHFSYADAVKVWGATGHDVLGLNDGGFFGIGVPSLRVAIELLFSAKGLLTLSPVLFAGLAGTALLYRRGKRAEALTIAAVFCAYLIYNSGYYLPFGGGSPGARFLIPVLPFISVPLAISYRRLPGVTTALAAASAVMIVTATITLPMIGNGDIGYWAHIVALGAFQHTIPTVFGAGNGWPALAPFLIAVGAAVVFAALATERVPLSRDLLYGVLAAVGWSFLAVLAPKLPPNSTGAPSHGVLPLVGVAAGAALLALVAAMLPDFRPRAYAALMRRRQPQREGATS